MPIRSSFLRACRDGASPTTPFTRLLGAYSLCACFGQKATFVEDYGLAVAEGLRSIDPESTASQLAWSPAGDEVYFVSAPTVGSAPARLEAAKLDDLSRRSLDAADGLRWLLTRSPDGESLYYGFAPGFGSALAGGELRRVQAHDGTEPETLARDVASFALSPDGALLAVGSNHGQPLRLIPTTGREVRTLSLGSPISFSPDGARLLCSEQPTGSFMGSSLRSPLFIIELASGAKTSVALDLDFPSASFPRLVRWSDAGIQLLHSTLYQVGVTELLGGTDEVVWAWQRSGSLSTDFAWAPNEVMGSTVRCSDDGFLECGTAFDLHVVELGTGRERVVARGLGAPWSGAFSDDGGRLAYATGTNLYVADVGAVE